MQKQELLLQIRHAPILMFVKSTLAVGNLKVYPNPASTYSTLDFDLEQAMNGGYVLLVNIAGAEVKVLIQPTKFQQGINSYHLDFSGISSGLYLIDIITDKGFRTQRIVVNPK